MGVSKNILSMADDDDYSPRTAVTVDMGVIPKSRDDDFIPTFNFIQATPHESEATWAIYDEDADDFVTMDITDQIESASDDGCCEKIKQTMSKTRISIVIIVLLISIAFCNDEEGDSYVGYFSKETFSE